MLEKHVFHGKISNSSILKDTCICPHCKESPQWEALFYIFAFIWESQKVFSQDFFKNFQNYKLVILTFSVAKTGFPSVTRHRLDPLGILAKKFDMYQGMFPWEEKSSNWEFLRNKSDVFANVRFFVEFWSEIKN